MEYKLLGAEPDEDEILELDADKVCLVTDTFSKADMFLQSDDKLGYIKLNAPGFYSFALPQPGRGHDGSTGNVKDNVDDGFAGKLTDKWTKEPADEINLIRAQEEKQLGLLQRDEVTGQLFMLLPLEVDVLLQPEREQVKDLLNEDGDDAYEDEDHEDASQTTLTDTPKLPDEQQREVCRFVVPKMSLNFQLTLQVGHLATD